MPLPSSRPTSPPPPIITTRPTTPVGVETLTELHRTMSSPEPASGSTVTPDNFTVALQSAPFAMPSSLPSQKGLQMPEQGFNRSFTPDFVSRPVPASAARAESPNSLFYGTAPQYDGMDIPYENSVRPPSLVMDFVRERWGRRVAAHQEKVVASQQNQVQLENLDANWHEEGEKFLKFFLGDVSEREDYIFSERACVFADTLLFNEDRRAKITLLHQPEGEYKGHRFLCNSLKPFFVARFPRVEPLLNFYSALETAMEQMLIYDPVPEPDLPDNRSIDTQEQKPVHNAYPLYKTLISVHYALAEGCIDSVSTIMKCDAECAVSAFSKVFQIGIDVTNEQSDVQVNSSENAESLQLEQAHNLTEDHVLVPVAKRVFSYLLPNIKRKNNEEMSAFVQQCNIFSASEVRFLSDLAHHPLNPVIKGIHEAMTLPLIHGDRVFIQGSFAYNNFEDSEDSEDSEDFEDFEDATLESEPLT